MNRKALSYTLQVKVVLISKCFGQCASFGLSNSMVNVSLHMDAHDNLDLAVSFSAQTAAQCVFEAPPLLRTNNQIIKAKDNGHD